jgi:hypothetical protein
MLDDDVTVALSITGALTPVGSHERDHPADGGRLRRLDRRPRTSTTPISASASTPGHVQADDVGCASRALRTDIFFDYTVLLDTDAFFRDYLGPRVPAHDARRVPLAVRRSCARARTRSASGGGRCPRHEFGVIYTRRAIRRSAQRGRALEAGSSDR